jgi:hypothetical protein
MLTEILMKAYQWFILTAAIVITGFEALLFTSPSSIFSPIETQTTVVLPGADPGSSLASEATTSNTSSKSGEAR